MDAEHGVGWRLETAMEFPKMLTNGAIRKDSLIYALGATIARHCQELGVHVNFAPVVDINSNPRNPIIGMRSFGEDPEEVTQKAILYAYGSLSQNVLPSSNTFRGMEIPIPILTIPCLSSHIPANASTLSNSILTSI